jgi:hypothetical protein
MRYPYKFFVLFLILFNVLEMAQAQSSPKFLREYDDDYGQTIVEWKYKNYLFRSSTPPIARPIITYEILKLQYGAYEVLTNETVFASELNAITHLINTKLKADYLRQQKDDPACFPAYVPVSLNEVDVRVDANQIYFSRLWNTEALVNAMVDCYFPQSEISFPFSEFERFFSK